MTYSQDILDRNPELKQVKVKKARHHPENDFQDMVIEAMHLLDWKVAHFRAVKIQRPDGSVYYQTPVQADSTGFPDILTVKTLNDNITVMLVMELKSEKGKLTQSQIGWLELMASINNVFVLVVTPEQFNDIVELLKSKGLSDIIVIWKRIALYAEKSFKLNLATHLKE